MQVNEATEAPKPRAGSRRMVAWLIVAPAVLLALAFAGANWRTFHLAWCKRLLGSPDAVRQRKAAVMIVNTHVRKGMTAEELSKLFSPVELDHYVETRKEGERRETVLTEVVFRDPDERLRIEFILDSRKRLVWACGWYLPPGNTRRVLELDTIEESNGRFILPAGWSGE